MRRIRDLFILVVVVVLTAAACSGSDDGASMSDTADGGGEASTSVAGSGAGGQVAAEDGTSTDDGAGGEGRVTELDVDLAGAETSAAADRDIVYRGDVAAEVEDLAAAVRQARDEAAAEGGFVFAQDVDDTSARVVLKVPSVRFDASFDAITAIGDVTSQSIEAEDVTEQFTDLESRLGTLETSIDRLRGFLAETANVDEISRLESELTRREAERDAIAGQLRVLEDRTTNATISAQYTLADDAEAATAPPEEESGPPGFARGLEVGWGAVVFVAGITATAGGFLLPFLPVLLLGVGIVVWHRRRAVRPGPA
ncbi:MAG: DUF4349 domain-containing protein [Acidimicrobiales bacterium]|nr:DUF4349 domain-containing protein [Acidimicrobiales bacterium]